MKSNFKYFAFMLTGLILGACGKQEGENNSAISSQGPIKVRAVHELGHDSLSGGAGDTDTLDHTSGTDTLSGGSGENDIF